MGRSAVTRLSLLGGAALAVVAAAFGATPAPAVTAVTAGAPITFGVPRVVDPIHAYGEPNMIVNPNGAIHASGPQGTGVQRSVWNISVDGGDSYRLAQATTCGEPFKSLGVCGKELGEAYDTSSLFPSKSDLGPGGGDTELAADRKGNVYYNDLYALACFSASFTADDGKTIESSPLGCSEPLGDREWMALYDPAPGEATVSPYTGKLPLLYMEYADQALGDRVDFTTDGTDYNVGTPAGEFCDDGVHNPNHTPPVVDTYTGDFLGLCSESSDSDGLALAVGEPDSAGHLTFHYNTAVLPEDIEGKPETLFPILTQDTARNLYAVWIDDTTYQAFYAWAPPGADNEWSAWSKPIRLDRPPSRTNLFPWAKAGGPGILDVAWYGTDKTLGELGPNGPSERKQQAWDVYFAQVDQANTATPHVVQVKATPHPMHYNDICMLGTLCISQQGNRNQADFFKLTIDPQGRAQIIYTDSSNRLSQANGTDTGADHQGAPLDVVIRQRTGLNAWTGAPLTADDVTTAVKGVTDPTGDALFKPLGGTNVPSADVTYLALDYNGEALTIRVDVDGPKLADVANAGKAPYAQLLVRWQVGDTLYHAGLEAPAAGGGVTAFAGPTKSVDLCSVSGCKPNYLDYRADPTATPPAVDVAGSGPVTYTITVPANAIGSPKRSALFESVMAFSVLAPRPAEVPLDNPSAEADEVNLQIEGTRTFNYRSGATAVLGKGAKPVTEPIPNVDPPKKPGTRPTMPSTGLPDALPALALAAVAGAALLRRRSAAPGA